MKNRSTLKAALACLSMILVIGVVAWMMQPQPTSASSHATFEVVVEKTEDGLKFTCKDGCAWKEATRACDGSDDCRTLLDARGVGRAPAADE
jgi:hypothetical protein